MSTNILTAQTAKTKITAGRDQLGEFAPKFAELNDDVLFGEVWSREQELSAKNRSMITIAALISGGNFEQLVPHLKKAKENGITKTEIAEIITHLAFYTGWPKAWSAFNIAKEIYGETDAPEFTQLNDEVLFVQAESPENELSYMRIAKIVVDSTQLENYKKALKEQMKSALQLEKGVLAYSAVHDKNNPAHITILETYSSMAAYEAHIQTGHFKKYKNTVACMVKSLELIDVVPVAIEVKTDAVPVAKNANLKNGKIFPLGIKVEQNFVGDAYLYMVFTDEKPLNAPIGSVTFAPKARNNWHEHAIGQILLVTEGEGWYQEWGKPAQFLKAGDVVNIPPNIKHWHGATKDSWFVHLAITPGSSDWFEPVGDETYNNVEK
jgi:alkylhydroperoxidase/carboxymuconolactone decarboxylase family protein YurZ/quercetin dioxygenase-like cupin family protein/quinol monooxygenase YgiN